MSTSKNSTPHCYIDTPWFRGGHAIVTLACAILGSMARTHDARKIAREEIDAAFPGVREKNANAKRILDMMQSRSVGARVPNSK
jgi:hypothetical protein